MKITQTIKSNPPIREFLKKLKRFDRTFMTQLNVASRETGRMLVEAIKGEIFDEDIPNTPEYQAKKAALGLYTEPLLRTGLMMMYIQHARRSFSWEYIGGQVGWPSSVRYPKQQFQATGRIKGQKRQRYRGITKESDADNKPIWLAALINEEGYGNRPERRFVTRAFNKVGPRIITLFELALKRSLPMSGMQEAPF